MDQTIIVAAISFAGTLLGTLGGIVTSAKLSNFRIEQLEKKVEKHNSVVERTMVLETDVKNIYHELEDLKSDIHDIKK